MSTYTTATEVAKDVLQKKTDILDHLNLDYEAYCNTIASFAMGNPSKYGKMKADVYVKLKEKLITQIYDTIYLILRKGQIRDDAGNAVSIIKDIDGDVLYPSYSSAEVNKQAVSISAQFNIVLNDILQILLPVKYDQLSTTGLKVKALADTNQ